MKASYIMPIMRQAFLHQAVDSVLDQTVSDIEVLIGDSGNCAYYRQDDRIKRFDASGLNMSQTLNMLIENASSEILMHAFDDDIQLPNRTEVCLEGIKDCDIFIASYNKMNEAGEVYAQEYAKPFNLEDYIHNGLNMPLFTGAYRKSKCPKWNPYLLHMNDYGWFLECHKRGLKINVSREIVANMRYWGGQLSHENPKNRILIELDQRLLKEIYGLDVRR